MATRELTDPVSWRQLVESGTVRDADGREHLLHSHLPRLECEVLQHWLRSTPARRVLEVGMAYGISTLALCEVLAEDDPPRSSPPLLVVDPHQETQWRSIGLTNLERAGHRALARWYAEPSETVLPRLLERRTWIDLAFVDGLHSFDQIAMELYFIHRLLPLGGVVALDDVQLGSVRKACRMLEALGTYEKLDLPPPVERRTDVRVRRMLGHAQVRIAGYRRVAEDRRPEDWCADF